MTKILFICHGNICRSPMAEFVFCHLARKRGQQRQLFAASAATSTEEIGNPVHPGTLRELAAHGIPAPARRAVQLTPADYAAYDLLIGMDSANLGNILRIIGTDPIGKVHRLLDFTPHPGDIADPWYTDNFSATYQDVLIGCNALLEQISGS